MGHAAFGRNDATAEEQFVRWSNENRCFESKAGCESRVLCNAPYEGVGSKDRQEIGVKYLEERWGGVCRVELVCQPILSECCVLTEYRKGRRRDRLLETVNAWFRMNASSPKRIKLTTAPGGIPARLSPSAEAEPEPQGTRVESITSTTFCSMAAGNRKKTSHVWYLGTYLVYNVLLISAKVALCEASYKNLRKIS